MAAPGAMERGYLAFAWGVPNRPRGSIDAPLDRHPNAREKMAVRQGGREAVTHYEVREVFSGQDGKPVASLLALRLETGRTHQIRVHLAHIGHPLLGDSVYGPHFKTKASQLGPREPGSADRPRPAGSARVSSGIGAPEIRRNSALGGPAAGGFAFPEKPPFSGEMTQAFRKSTVIAKSYTSHTGR